MKNRITVIIFLILIFGITLATFIHEDILFSEKENRYLAQKPEVTIENLYSGEYGTEYEEYIQDQFIFRDKWITLKTYVELSLGKTEINGVFIGKDNYYIENHDNSDYESDLAINNIKYISEFADKYSETIGNDNISIMIVPTAQSILKNKLPAMAVPYDENVYIDEIKKSLNEDMFIDVSDTLLENNDDYIYYKTDHHWTTYGAYLAYNKWASDKDKKLANNDEYDIMAATDEFYGTIYSKLNIKMEADTINLYTKKDSNYKVIYNLGQKETSTIYDEDYLSKKDKYSVFFGGNFSLMEITSENKNNKRILVLKDSYANSFIPFMLDNYETTYVVDLRYFNGSVEALIDEYNVTDLLLLYNANTIATDKNIYRLLR